jgi:hypothetical protein
MSDKGVTFVGCRVAKSDLFYVARIRFPAFLRGPVFLIETLSPCGELFVNAVRIGNGENLLAAAAVPAAVFEQPPIVPLTLPAMGPDVELSMQFRNDADEPACFLLWLGSEMGIRVKYQQLVAARELARFKA